MSKFTAFIVFNIAVYIIYAIIDKLFTMLNLYSSPQLGESLLVMPSSEDMVYICINIVISSILGFYVTQKIKRKL